jgi:hypothetical protein
MNDDDVNQCAVRTSHAAFLVFLMRCDALLCVAMRLTPCTCLSPGQVVRVDSRTV